MKTNHRCNGCNEYQSLGRRDFLRILGVGAAGLTVPSWLPRVAYAQGGAARDVIVSIFLRGGADGLSLCVPYGEDAYYRIRRSQAIGAPGSNDSVKCVDLDGFFGLPPSMASLYPAYDSGDLLVVHAAGLTDGTRSHFDAMVYMETGGSEEEYVATGWLGRHLMATGPATPDTVLRAVGINPSLQRTLSGAPQALPVPDPGSFFFPGSESSAEQRLDLLRGLYNETPEPLRSAANNTYKTLDVLNAIDFENYAPSGGAVYGDNDFGKSLRSAAALIKAHVGVEAIAIDIGGWDTHADAGARGGYLANLMGQLAQGLSAFHKDVLAGGERNVTVVTMSEFGRNAAENGSEGTDHGFGNCMFVMGGHIDGGRVLADWPGLEDDQLFEGQDLAITTDYRNVLAEVLARRAATGDLGFVFPGLEVTFPGITT